MGDLFWFVFRKDIGRKLTALGLAVVVWLMLAYQLRASEEVPLDIHFVPDRETAEQEADERPGVWVVVPPELILQSVAKDPMVVVTAAGLKTDISALRLSAVFEVPPDALGTADSGEHLIYLNNTSRYRGGDVDVRDVVLDMAPKRMALKLASRDEEVFDLGPNNVQIENVPKEGTEIDRSRITVNPSQVVLTGPREAIETLRRDPNQIRLEPVDVKDRGFKVSREVGLDPRKVDRLVSMRSAGGVVQVDVPIVPERIEVVIYRVRIKYENEDVLLRRGKRVVNSTDTIDLKLRGSASVLGALGEETLRKSVSVLYDWAEASNDVASPRPRLHLDKSLPDSIEVLDLDGRQPEIEYTLEDIVPAAPSEIDRTGEAP